MVANKIPLSFVPQQLSTTPHTKTSLTRCVCALCQQQSNQTNREPRATNTNTVAVVSCACLPAQLWHRVCAVCMCEFFFVFGCFTWKLEIVHSARSLACIILVDLCLCEQCTNNVKHHAHACFPCPMIIIVAFCADATTTLQSSVGGGGGFKSCLVEVSKTDWFWTSCFFVCGNIELRVSKSKWLRVKINVHKTSHASQTIANRTTRKIQHVFLIEFQPSSVSKTLKFQDVLDVWMRSHFCSACSAEH